MKESIALSRHALTSTERAFVFPKAVQFAASLNVATEQIHHWGVSIQWENSGKTPTRYLRHYFNLEVRPDLLPDDFDFPDLPIPGTQRPAISIPTLIGPNSSIASDSIDVSIEQMNEIKDGIAHCYIWGWSEYDDVLPDTRRHRTEFCYKIKVGGDPRDPHRSSIGWNMHHAHNGADDECVRRMKTTSPKNPALPVV
jgi:hypothetical protein